MRLSTAQKILLQILLINFLTLILKPQANAQALLASNYSVGNNRHGPALFNEEENENERSGVEPNENTILTHTDLRIDYYHPINLVSNRVAENNFKVYPKFCPRFSRIYATCFRSNMRVAFKPFKLIITPLWK